MLDFYKTSGGRRLCDSTMPEIAKQLKRIADELRQANKLKAHELGLTSTADVAEEFVNKDKDDEDVVVNPQLANVLSAEDAENFAGGLLKEMVDASSIEVSSPDDISKLKDSKVVSRLRRAGVSIEYNYKGDEAELKWE